MNQMECDRCHGSADALNSHVVASGDGVTSLLFCIDCWELYETYRDGAARCHHG